MHTSTLFLAGVSLAITAIATPLASRATFPLATGFDKYCMNLVPFDQEGDSLKFMASCAESGAHYMGTTLSTSVIDLNECLANDDGIISGRAHGGALGSCSCDFGTHVCGTDGGCPTTTTRCTCKGKNEKEYINKFDISEFLGVGYDNDNHLVLDCFGVHGAWDQCVVEGAQASC